MQANVIEYELLDRVAGEEGFIWQYDRGQKLKFKNVTLPFSYEVHFANRSSGPALKVYGDDSGVVIPYAVTSSGKPVYMWLYLIEDENSAQTVYGNTIQVRLRANVPTEEPTPEQQTLIEQAIGLLNAGVQAVQTIEENIPTTVLDVIDQAIEEGRIKGDPGAVFTPSIVDGVMIWSNNGGLPNPEPTDFKQELGLDRFATKQEVNSKIDSGLIGSANGVAGLDASGRVPSEQLPSYVDDVLEYPSLSMFPNPGESGKIYVSLSNNHQYRWTGSQYIDITGGDLESRKADKRDTVLETTLSRGRAGLSPVGVASIAFGNSAEASGDYSVSIGQSTIATGECSSAVGGYTKAHGRYSSAENAYATASAEAAHAEGYFSVASGYASHAEGGNTQAIGNNSHAEGQSTKAYSQRSHAEGTGSIAEGASSHAEGSSTHTYGDSAHSEGNQTVASSNYSHAEGYGGEFTSGSTTVLSGAFGTASHSEGYYTRAQGDGAHSEGGYTYANSNYAHAEGYETRVTASDGAHAEGRGTLASGLSAHAEGYLSTAQGHESHAEGHNTAAIGESSHSEGSGTTASGPQAHSEGLNTTASGYQSHVEGTNTRAEGHQSHAEGYGGTFTLFGTQYTSKAAGTADHTEGYLTATAVNGNPGHHAEGYQTAATGGAAHSEGSGTLASGIFSHSEGYNTKASNFCTHAEGSSTTASGAESHAENYSTTASGAASHAEGYGTTASGTNSHAEGFDTIAAGASSHVSGMHNIADSYDNWIEWTQGEHCVPGDKRKRTRLVDEQTVVEGFICKTENTDSAWVASHWTNQAGRMNYAEIVGNGISYDEKSNARTLDWDGNEEIAGRFKGKGIALAQYAFSTGNYAIAMGMGATASGEDSLAQGGGATASGFASHAQGSGCVASGTHAHASGSGATASGNTSFAHGSGVVASGFNAIAFGAGGQVAGDYAFSSGENVSVNGNNSFAFGRYNVADTVPDYSNWPEWVSGTPYVVGANVYREITTVEHYDWGDQTDTRTYYYTCTEANSDATFDESKWEEHLYGESAYAEIVGGGLGTERKANIRTLDWRGNERLKGDLYVRCNADGTGGMKVLAATDVDGFATDADIANLINNYPVVFGGV